MAILSDSHLANLGLASYGSNVRISDKASIYGASRIHIGNNVRIDDFCVLSAGHGGIRIGSYVHIAVGSSLIGADSIVMEDFTTISSRVSLYSSSDDYSGGSMTNPMLPDSYKNVVNAPVRLGRHVIVGTGSVVLPGVYIKDGCAIGALSLVKENCDEFGIYVGAPARRIKERSRQLLNLEKLFFSNISASDSN